MAMTGDELRDLAALADNAAAAGEDEALVSAIRSLYVEVQSLLDILGSVEFVAPGDESRGVPSCPFCGWEYHGGKRKHAAACDLGRALGR